VHDATKSCAHTLDELRHERRETCPQTGQRLEAGRVPVLRNLFDRPRVQSRLQAAAGRVGPDLSAISLAMVVLWEQDDQTVGSLGEKLFLESSTLTPLLKRLEALGHIQRARDPDDERQVRVRLTESGRAMRETAREIPSCIRMASGLEIGELARLQTEIVALRSALERYGRD